MKYVRHRARGLGGVALIALVLLHMETELGVVVFISLSLLVTLGLLKVLPKLRTADAIVVVAGMEGALPSVVGGLVGIPA